MTNSVSKTTSPPNKHTHAAANHGNHAHADANEQPAAPVDSRNIPWRCCQCGYRNPDTWYTRCRACGHEGGGCFVCWAEG
ncbi:uncharacterized protein K452DRAFT_287808 [Aplosporella prunicola CBS 121167]|uniref:Uncharacterized protein n=1 Tax=Aplosporella prunicola CBS 121167 TaxID=1176127 RepID=A0A6A6BE96_9PEZI|nr:uncharacterized protein K452DRAFT_287808 [Aplosporella prunicola CBS 121167]KAF2141838.1 hypothetical protein K452DRAFT_287808 [Aplosporella prunicola CBS 121167]